MLQVKATMDVNAMNDKIEATQEELLACPFCGSSNIDPTGWSTLPEYAKTPEERSGPACDDCGATATSIQHWNTRTASPRPDGKALAEIEFGARLSASEVACYRWPDNAEMRQAFCDGAVHAAISAAAPVKDGEGGK